MRAGEQEVDCRRPERCRVAKSALVLLLVTAFISSAFGSGPVGDDGDRRRVFRSARSTYVPIDSQAYAMFDRLISAGLVESSFVGIRPWTRVECARLVTEAENNIDERTSKEMLGVIATLKAEFPPVDEEPTLPVEQVYTRFLGISGEPLRDSYHFGQTLVNDYGRPYWTGGNAFVGGSGAFAAGPFTVAARGEYQYAPGGPVYAPSTQSLIKYTDGTPAPLLPDSRQISQFRLLEAYVAFPIRNVEFSVGKQALWWGPDTSGAMLFSNNSEPPYMLHIAQISPVRLPWIFHYLGPMRLDGFFGKMAGHQYPSGPYFHGQKITLKPTKNLELGFSRTVVFAGAGRGLTFRSFWKSFISVGDYKGVISGGRNDVGDRRGGFDFSYRVPRLRQWLLLTADMFTDDDPSPLAAPQRSAFTPGIYLSHVPGVPKLDLRVEAPTSSLPEMANTLGRFFYYNYAFFDGYTNKGMLIGHWIGRQSKAIVATSSYWFTPEKVLSTNFRHSTTDPEFIAGGGNLTDLGASYSSPLGKQFSVVGSAQFERWNYPGLMASPQRNFVTSLELRWEPNKFLKVRK